MRWNLLLPIALLVLCIIGVTLYLGAPVPLPRAVEVEVLEGKVSVSRDGVKKSVEAGQSLSSTDRAAPNENAPTPQVAQSVVTDASAIDRVLAQANTPAAVSLKITDAMDEPITRGEVEWNGQRLPFKNGRFDLPPEWKPPLDLTVSAEGYFPSSQTISASSDPVAEHTVELEYQCSYEVQVIKADTNALFKMFKQLVKPDKLGSPLAGAEVVLMQGPAVQRPLRTQVLLDISNSNVDITAEAVLRDNTILFANSNNPLDQQRPPMESEAIPQDGDRLLSLNYCTWTENDSLHHIEKSKSRLFFHITPPFQPLVSPRLRIWDTLSQNHLDNERSRGLDHLEFERNGERLYSDLPFACSYNPSTILDRKITDSSGRCRFENLKPDVYFVKATWKEFRSSVLPLYPALNGNTLIAADSARLQVNVKRDMVKSRYSSSGEVKNADVLVQSVDGSSKGRYAGKTDDYGRFFLDSIPFGEYQCTVHMPNGEKGGPVTQPFTVEETGKYLDIVIPNSGATLSGRVVTGPEKKPVAGFALSLMATSRKIPNQSGYGSWEAGDLKTDSDGTFVFRNLPPCNYELIAASGLKYFNGYLPALPEPRKDGPVSYSSSELYPRSNGGDSTLLVVDMAEEDITDIEIPVDPAVETHLRGLVTDSAQSPVAGAVITAEPLIHGRPGRCLTDENGRFDFMFFCRPSAIEIPPTIGEYNGSLLYTQHGRSLEDQRTVKVKAVAGEITPAYWKKENGEGSYSLVEEAVAVQAEAETEVQFAIGEGASDIRLVLEQLDPGFTVRGSVKTYDGGIPQSRWFNAYPERSNTKAVLNADGTFVVSGVAPGDFRISLYIPFETIEHPKYGEQHQYKYKQGSVRGIMPEDGNLPPVELALEQAGHLAGVVLDAGGKPIPHAIVRASPDGMNNTHSEADDNGLFWLYEGLDIGREYSLEVYLPNQQEPSLVTNGVVPTLEDIVLQVK